MHGKLSVRYKPSSESNHSECGWYRLRLPSSDGALRVHDPDAPTIHISPTAAVFWLEKDNAEPVRVDFNMLLRLANEWASLLKLEVAA